MAVTLFLGDLHLNPAAPERTARFRRFVELVRTEWPGRSADAYILGDLFDFWYEMRSAILDHYAAELEVLKEFAGTVRSVNILFGNRDFAYGNWLPEKVAPNIGILGDGADVEVEGRKLRLEHGDLLCRRDEGYQQIGRASWRGRGWR